MNAVKIGQVWQDKDKRRNTEILVVDLNAEEVVGRNIATGEDKTYKVDRLTKRWELVKAPKPSKPKVIKPTTEKITRELWLEKAVDELRTEIFAQHDVPTVRVSVGWPGGHGPKSKTIGQCWKSETATDKVSQIFISPVLADPIVVLETLVHEIVHAIDDTESGHRGRFKAIAEGVGLEGKMTATHAGEALREKLVTVSESLGGYPHAAISMIDKPKPQATYMLKVQCAEDPEFFVRMTRTKIEEFGLPICPCHKLEMEEV